MQADVLLRALKPDLYRVNAFRLAQLPATATALAATLVAGATQFAPTEKALATDAVGAVNGAATAAAQITPPQVTDGAEASAAVTCDATPGIPSAQIACVRSIGYVSSRQRRRWHG